MNIGIDIDDTITNTTDTAIVYAKEYVKEVLKREISIDESKIKDNDYVKDMFGLSEEENIEFWSTYYEKILYNVTPKENVSNVINKLKQEGNKIVIITARWSDETRDATKISEKWLNANNILYDEIIVNAQNKGKVATEKEIDIFIDDSIRNCESVINEGIETYLFTSKFNKNSNLKPELKRIYSWNEVYEMISNK